MFEAAIDNFLFDLYFSCHEYSERYVVVLFSDGRYETRTSDNADYSEEVMIIPIEPGDTVFDIENRYKEIDGLKKKMTHRSHVDSCY